MKLSPSLSDDSRDSFFSIISLSLLSFLPHTDFNVDMLPSWSPPASPSGTTIDMDFHWNKIERKCSFIINDGLGSAFLFARTPMKHSYMDRHHHTMTMLMMLGHELYSPSHSHTHGPSLFVTLSFVSFSLSSVDIQSLSSGSTQTDGKFLLPQQRPFMCQVRKLRVCTVCLPCCLRVTFLGSFSRTEMSDLHDSLPPPPHPFPLCAWKHTRLSQTSHARLGSCFTDPFFPLVHVQWWWFSPLFLPSSRLLFPLLILFSLLSFIASFQTPDSTEKPDGLQIVFLRHNKKHSGLYKCLQVRVSLFHGIKRDFNNTRLKTSSHIFHFSFLYNLILSPPPLPSSLSLHTSTLCHWTSLLSREYKEMKKLMISRWLSERENPISSCRDERKSGSERDGNTSECPLTRGLKPETKLLNSNHKRDMHKWSSLVSIQSLISRAKSCRFATSFTQHVCHSMSVPYNLTLPSISLCTQKKREVRFVIYN